MKSGLEFAASELPNYLLTHTARQLRCLAVCELFENCIASTKVKVFYTIQATKG